MGRIKVSETADRKTTERGAIARAADVATALVRSAVYRAYLHLVGTNAGGKIANAIWRPT
jgi:hypothetical protein